MWGLKNSNINKADILVTFDVQSLYTCIPYEIDFDVLIQYLNKHPEGILPPNEFLLTLLEMILTMNFKHLECYYFAI